MAKRGQSSTPTSDPTTEQPTDVATLEPTHETELERMQRELEEARRERDAALAARAKLAGTGVRTGGGRPARVATLESVTAKQEKTPAKWGVLQVAAFVNERMEVGQSMDEAFSQVLDRIQEHATHILLEERAKYGSLMEATWGYFKSPIPKGAVSRGIDTPAGSIPEPVDSISGSDAPTSEPTDEPTNDAAVEQVAEDAAQYFQLSDS